MRALRIFSVVLVVTLVISSCASSTAAVSTAPTTAPAVTTAAEAATTPAEAAPAEAAADEWGTVVIKPGEQVKIGFGAALSGAGVDILGIDEQRGVELAIADQGDLLGFQIQLVAEDDLCSAEGGTTVANKFVADPGIVAVIGEMCSSGSLAAMDIYDQYHYVMVSPSSTTPVLTTRGSPIFNRVCWNDKIQGPAAAEFVRNVLKVDRVATVHDGSPYGEGLATAMGDAFTELGGTVVATEAVNVGDTNMRSLLEGIKAADPQLIYFGGFVAEGAYLAAQRVDVGMQDVYFMGADGILAENFIDAAGDAGEGAYASAANPGEAGAGMAAFLEAYQAKYGEEPPAPFHAHAYDAAMIIFKAIEQVGQVDANGNLVIGRKALAEAVRATSGYQGLTGTITCDEYGDCGTGTVAVSQVKDGAFVVVWPEE